MAYEVHIEHRPQQPAAVLRAHVKESEIAPFLSRAFGAVGAALAAQSMAPTGPPFGVYRIENGEFDVAAGFPASGVIRNQDSVESITLPGGTVAVTTHVGPYSTIGEAYDALITWVSSQGYVAAGDPWESYLDGPEVPMPHTLVCLPCRKNGSPVDQ
jgi:effector-binding domain-containing protein